ncbi:hypothetical protein T440DRAFT_473735 [Plenodomus tracheiphilus IPT5]|uniref:Zn(2)-C6 fungal-type domain-containing protein n=1 Tax=Plenodomus tracheiphilus IPT5 TaxID=1408161 RepID=A0A6A7ALM8_9PLEO|nr:hypothetical protein T440DRAFT_473735 [Plenodomus tracheiphilus IPT5]
MSSVTSYRLPLDPRKLPVPRLRPGDEARSATAQRCQRRRVSRACVSCRARKVRCDGGRPQCQNCQGNYGLCVYIQSRKDRLKVATEHVHNMSTFLQDLKDSVTEEKKQEIDELLGRVINEVFDATASVDMPKFSAPSSIHKEVNMPAVVGCVEDLDASSKDKVQDVEVRADNFVGRSCGQQCLWCLQRQMLYPKQVLSATEDFVNKVQVPLGWSADCTSRFTLAGVETEPTIWF